MDIFRECYSLLQSFDTNTMSVILATLVTDGFEAHNIVLWGLHLTAKL